MLAWDGFYVPPRVAHLKHQLDSIALDHIQENGRLNHGHERVFSDRKETHWGKRRLKRDQ
jgi:hypothetical protein